VNNDYIVEMKGISKSFGAVQALKKVDLELRRGEILGLVGDNAAGKSTLMKTLAGAYVPDEGEILIEGQVVSINNPQDARAAGISMVYQDLALFNNMDVASNIFVRRELRKGAFLDMGAMREETRKLLNSLKINISSPSLLVAKMSGGQRQMVACARAMAFESKILLLDEPTAALGVKEANTLLALIKEWKDQGMSIILITQRIPDILAIGDRVMVMKAGVRQGILAVSDSTLEDVVDLIVKGREGVEKPTDQEAELDFLSFG
jgi:simple sugar transport system ATP-binding protein